MRPPRCIALGAEEVAWPLWAKVFFPLYLVSLVTSMSGMEIFSSAIIFCLIAYYIRKKDFPKHAPPFWRPLIAFVVVEAIGVYLGEASTKQKLYDLSRMRFFLVYIALYYALSAFSLRRESLRILVWVVVALCVYGTVQHFVAIDLFRPTGKKVLMYAVPKGKIGPLVVGTFNHHLTFSNIFLFYAVLFTSVGLYFRKRNLTFLILGLWIYLLCFWTDSRSAWVAIPVTLLGLSRAYSRRAFWLALSGLALLLMLFFRFDLGARERLVRTFVKKDALYQLGPRERLWKAQFEMIREHPWFGVGFNNNERRAKEVVDRLYPGEKNFYGHAHSNVLQILATMGVVGLVVYLWLWAEIFTRAFRVVRYYARDTVEHWVGIGLIFGFIGFHIQGISQWNFGDAEVIHNVMFFWALLAALPVPERLAAASKANCPVLSPA